MSRDADEIKTLIEHELPAIYDRIVCGDTKDECMDFSTDILKMLLAHGEDVIMVQVRTRGEGEPLHHFLLWREGGTEHPVMIDPTIGQLYADHQDVFIGTREDLREMIESDGNFDRQAREIFKEYWRPTVHLFEPPDGAVYEELGITPPSKQDKSDFQQKWCEDNDFKVIQRERFSQPVLSTAGTPSHSGRRY